MKSNPLYLVLAQGGAQGVEDAVALGVVLYGATTRDDIQKRLQIYQEVRIKRASVIQILSNMGADHSVSVDDLREYLDDEQMPCMASTPILSPSVNQS